MMQRTKMSLLDDYDYDTMPAMSVMEQYDVTSFFLDEMYIIWEVF